MEANIALRDVKVALEQREYGTFTGARRAADAEHLARLKGKTDVLQYRMFRLRIDKLADVDFHDAASFRQRFAAVIDHRRFGQHGANTAVGGAAALHDVKHPGQRQHRPDHQPQIHGKAGQLAGVSVPCTTIQLPPPIASIFAMPIAI